MFGYKMSFKFEQGLVSNVSIEPNEHLDGYFRLKYKQYLVSNTSNVHEMFGILQYPGQLWIHEKKSFSCVTEGVNFTFIVFI